MQRRPNAARLDPALQARLAARVARAWILATSPDDGSREPGEAVRLAERAAALNGQQDVMVLDVVAAAYAAAAV